MSLSEKQKAAQKKYTEKNNPVFITISFKHDRIFGKEIKDFLANNNLTANSYIKKLIEKDFKEKNIPFTKNSPEEK